jgi:hypothetical protein
MATFIGVDVMAAKKSILARQASELGEAVTRLFTGEPPPPAKRTKSKGRKAASKGPAKPARRSVSKRKSRKR